MEDVHAPKQQQQDQQQTWENKAHASDFLCSTLTLLLLLHLHDPNSSSLQFLLLHAQTWYKIWWWSFCVHVVSLVFMCEHVSERVKCEFLSFYFNFNFSSVWCDGMCRYCWINNRFSVKFTQVWSCCWSIFRNIFKFSNYSYFIETRNAAFKKLSFLLIKLDTLTTDDVWAYKTTFQFLIHVNSIFNIKVSTYSTYFSFF